MSVDEGGTVLPEVPAPEVSAPEGVSPVAEEPRRNWMRRVTELPVLILIAFAIAVVVKTFLLQAFYIPSASMEPGLQINDRIIVNKLVYRVHEPRRGDIVVFARDEDRTPKNFLQRLRGVLFDGLGVTRPGHTDFIKRVIALPGETIEITRGQVFITPVRGARFELDEPYAVEEPEGAFGPYVVPAGTLFVMGDNRPNSSDSRSDLGPVDRADVIGRAVVRVWPLSRVGVLRRARYDGEPQAMLAR